MDATIWVALGWVLALGATTPVQESATRPDAARSAEAPVWGRWRGTLSGLESPSAIVIEFDASGGERDADAPREEDEDATLAPQSGDAPPLSGRLWVSEEFGDRVRVFSPGGHEELAIGRSGHGPGELRAPAGLALDGAGGVFVADAGNHRVQRFDARGAARGAFGRFGAAPGEFNEPRGLACDGSRLVVADTRNHRVQVFDLEGRVLAVFGRRGRAVGEFSYPSAVALDDAGHVSVADSGNHRVQTFDLEGRALATWGEFGPYPGFFADPSGLAWNAGLVYVADRENHRVQAFDAGGALRFDWGVHALLPREGDGKLHYPDRVALAPDASYAAVAESFENRVQLFDRWPTGGAPPIDPLRFERDQSAHYGAGVDIQGTMMVQVEPGAPSLLLWDLGAGSEPIQVTRVRVFGHRTGQLARPVDVAFDRQRDWVHLADPENRRLVTYSFRRRGEGEELRYDPFLTKLVRSLDLGRLAAQAGGPDVDPEALACDGAGRIWVADATHRALFVFDRALGFLGRARVEGLERPVDVGVDASGRHLLVVDAMARCVRRFDLSEAPAEDPLAPRELARLGGAAAEEGALVRPAGALELADGRFWVSDEARHHIVEFDAQGAPVRTLGKPGVRRVEFYRPRGLAQDPAGRVVVVDWGNHRGQILAPDGGYLESFGARFFTKPARLER